MRNERSAWRLWGAIVVAGMLGGCKASDEAAWALQHASVTATADGLTGYQVWEFYGVRWKKKRAEKHHLCARVQSLEGQGVSRGLEGCPDCVVIAVDVQELESDCDGPEASLPGFSGPMFYAFGEVDTSNADADPHPGTSLGWYSSWDGQVAEPLGWAWPEAIDQPGEEYEPGWVSEQRYTLWPGSVWEL